MQVIHTETSIATLLTKGKVKSHLPLSLLHTV